MSPEAAEAKAQLVAGLVLRGIPASEATLMVSVHESRADGIHRITLRLVACPLRFSVQMARVEPFSDLAGGVVRILPDWSTIISERVECLLYEFDAQRGVPSA